jgi:hypothetical protein
MRTIEEKKSIKDVIECFEQLGYTCSATNEQFEKWDIEVTGRTTGVIEVKNRKLTTQEFQKYFPIGLYFQADKYKNLSNKNALYVNIFYYNDIKLILCWKVDELNLTKVIRKMTDSQEFSTTNGEKVDKEVYLLPKDNCIAYLKYMNYPWKRLDNSKILNQVKNAEERNFIENYFV